MKILVLGSGVIGVTNAYYLAKLGHEVTVVDRQPAAALETSYANAGQLSPGYSSPWSAPGVPLKAVKWMMQDLAPLRIQPALDPVLFKWMAKMLGNCNEAAYRVNKSRMLRIAEYSRDSMVELNNDVVLNYDQRFGGTLQVFRTDKQVASSKADVAILKECGVNYEVLDRQGCIDREPALAHVKEKIIGGLRLPGDGTGDCFKFTQGLAKECEKLGVTFMYNTTIKGLIENQGDIQGVQLESQIIKADRYVVALGSYSPLLLSKVGIKIPVYPVKGYSLTLPIIDESRAPVSTVMDETYKIGVTRFDDRIRVGGTAELTGYDLSLKDKRRNNVDFVVSDLFSGGGDLSKAEFWTGLRPMTPDGTPVLGATKYPSLYLNTGHGTLGWTMAVGSARFVTDIICGRQPDIDPSGLNIERYA
ncbi:D-amino acid dehydrogenase [Neptunomonas antarctica]|uniref:D-amino acid dehydrogenase n=1 Tax=Neptunomonas antarctica TaxID=619304 RepID=A0A1N7K6G7_9GAMM|nr:D-amino acid dehydrogenase [Neptunomonas antarctica]SIS57191.1 D-amino acid dehydrogenase small subunit [Neptunomonas antarctica]